MFKSNNRAYSVQNSAKNGQSWTILKKKTKVDYTLTEFSNQFFENIFFNSHICSILRVLFFPAFASAITKIFYRRLLDPPAWIPKDVQFLPIILLSQLRISLFFWNIIFYSKNPNLIKIFKATASWM